MKLRSVLAVALLCGLAACDTTKSTDSAAPGAVASPCCKGKPAGDPSCCKTSGKECNPANCADPSKCTDKAAAGATCPVTGAPVAAPGAVGETKAGCCSRKAASECTSTTAAPGAVADAPKGCCSKKAATNG